jgi:hypothetical protein
VEEALVANQKQTSPDFHVDGATCPERVTLGPGATFQCTVTVEGVAAPYNVTVSDANATKDVSRLTMQPAKAIVSVNKLVSIVKGVATDPAADVDCGRARVLVVDAGSTLDCQVTDVRGQHTVMLRVEDVQGRVTVLGER